MLEIDFEAQRTAQEQLDPGERLLWFDRPDPKRHLVSNLPGVLFGIPWTAFAVFWTIAAAGGLRGFDHLGWHSLFALWGVPFILIGFGILTSPYRAYRKAKRTVYAITNRRVMIVSGGGARKVQSYSGPDIGPIERVERGSGRGDVRFARAVAEARPVGRLTVAQKKMQDPSLTGIFTGIRDPRHVERLLLETFKRQTEPSVAEESTSRGFGSFKSQ